MDAIRAGFLNDQRTLLNVVKLNVSNRIVMITALEQNVAEAITVAVWLDGG